MNEDVASRTSFLTRFFQAGAIAAPILGAVAFILFLNGRREEAATVTAAPVPAVATSPGTPSSDTGTANLAGSGEAAFADRPSGADIDDSGSPSELPGEPASTTTGASPTGSEVTLSPQAGTGSPIVWIRSGEAVEILDAPGGEVVATQTDKTEFGSPSVFSVRRERRRWVGVSTPLQPNDDLGWIRADPRRLRAGYVHHSVVVDLSKRSAKLFYGDSQVSSWRVTVGAAGTETPTGRFAVTDTFRGNLNAAYGCCAVALSATQPNLPSGWLGGNRIAFHGTDGPLGVAASNGCIRSSDKEVDVLVETVPLGTPVTIRG